MLMPDLTQFIQNKIFPTCDQNKKKVISETFYILFAVLRFQNQVQSLYLQHISVWISHFQAFNSPPYMPSGPVLDSLGPEHTMVVHSQMGKQGKRHCLKHPAITLWETLPLVFPQLKFITLRDPQSSQTEDFLFEPRSAHNLFRDISGTSRLGIVSPVLQYVLQTGTDP